MTTCPLCDRDAASHDGVYGVHYDKAGALRCPNSGQPVGPPDATPEAEKPVKKAARKKAAPKP